MSELSVCLRIHSKAWGKGKVTASTALLFPDVALLMRAHTHAHSVRYIHEQACSQTDMHIHTNTDRKGRSRMSWMLLNSYPKWRFYMGACVWVRVRAHNILQLFFPISDKLKLTFFTLCHTHFISGQEFPRWRLVISRFSNLYHMDSLYNQQLPLNADFPTLDTITIHV